MKHIVFATAGVLFACAGAQREQKQSANGKAAAVADNQKKPKQICEYEEETGSHFRHKVCHTPSMVGQDPSVTTTAAPSSPVAPTTPAQTAQPAPDPIRNGRSHASI